MAKKASHRIANAKQSKSTVKSTSGIKSLALLGIPDSELTAAGQTAKQFIAGKLAQAYYDMIPELKPFMRSGLTFADAACEQWTAFEKWLVSLGLPGDAILAGKIVAADLFREYATDDDVKHFDLANFVDIVKTYVANKESEARIRGRLNQPDNDTTEMPKSKNINTGPVAAPKGAPGRKQDEAKTLHAVRANELRSLTPQTEWKDVAKAINSEFQLTGDGRYGRYDHNQIRLLVRDKIKAGVIRGN